MGTRALSFLLASGDVLCVVMLDVAAASEAGEAAAVAGGQHADQQTGGDRGDHW
jgi:hypothetical protein